jgi:predicted nucleic acid-binding protein
VAYVVVDTDVSSQILRDRLPPTLATQLVGKTLCATFVTVAELTQWAEMHTWGARRKLALTQWLASLLVLPYNEREDDTVLEEVARTWGDLRACAAAGTTAATERHVDRSYLPGLRPAAGHPEREGLRRLRGARRAHSRHQLKPCQSEGPGSASQGLLVFPAVTSPRC